MADVRRKTNLTPKAAQTRTTKIARAKTQAQEDLQGAAAVRLHAQARKAKSAALTTKNSVRPTGPAPAPKPKMGHYPPKQASKRPGRSTGF